MGHTSGGLGQASGGIRIPGIKIVIKKYGLTVRVGADLGVDVGERDAGDDRAPQQREHDPDLGR